LVEVAAVRGSSSHEVELVEHPVGDGPRVTDGVHVSRNQIVVVAEGRHAVCTASAAVEQRMLIGVAVEKSLLIADLIIRSKEPDIRIGPAFKRTFECLVKIRPSGVDGKEAVLTVAFESTEVMQAVF